MSIEDYLVAGDEWSFTVELQKPSGTPWSPPVSSSVSARVLNAYRRPITDTVTSLSFTDADVTVAIPDTQTSKIRFYDPQEAERPVEIEVQVTDASLAQPETFYYARRCRKGAI